MEYKTLGNTGLLVSTLCFGTMTFYGGEGFWKAIGSVDQSGADELIKASIEAGINFIDTADVYSEGESEKTLGQSLKNLKIARKDVVLATKVFGRMGPGRNDAGASRGHILDAVDASLHRLQTDHIDLYQIHGNDPVTPIEETLRALDTLVTQGKVRYIGCSNWQAWKIAKALGISEFKNLAPFDTLQAYYSIAGRDLEREVVPMLEAEKTGPAGLESARRRSALRQVQSRKSEARGIPPLGVRLSHSRQGARLEDSRRHGSNRQSPWLQPRADLTRMAVDQARRHFCNSRGQAPRPAPGQPGCCGPQAHRRRNQATRRSERAPARVSGLDAFTPRGQPSRTASSPAEVKLR